MIDWQSPEIQEQCAGIFGHAAACLSGVYLWHFLTTWSEVEAKLLFRTIKFSWAFLPYFASRYASAIVMVMVNFVTQASFVNNCEVEAKVISILINLSIASSSTTILLRPLALWREAKFICYLLYSLSLAHWALGINSTISSISFSEIMKNCTTVVPLGANHDAGIISFYFYTVVFDLTILAFTISGLHQHSVARLSPLWMVLCRQGYAYVGFAAALDIPMLVFNWLDLNGTMNVAFAICGGAASTIVASTAVISLLKLREQNHYEGNEGETAMHETPQNRLTTFVDLEIASCASSRVATSR